MLTDKSKISFFKLNFTPSFLSRDTEATLSTEFKKGFKCSIHCHAYKWNGFFCESGKLIVRVWQDGAQEGLVDETILTPGDFTQVKPGYYHQFEGLEDGIAFELYWAEFNHDDIIRKTQGSSVEIL